MSTTSQDIEAVLHGTLPVALTVATGDAIEIDWLNARAPILRSTRSFPYGTFRARPEVAQSEPPKHFGTRTANATAIQAIAFATGTLDYLLEERDAASITSITGTLSGSPHTFVADTDYTLVGSDPNDTFLDTVRWASGGDKPDNGTTFTVTYVHKRWEELLVARSMVPFLLTVHAKDLASGTGGATQAYDHTMLGPMLARAAHDHFRFKRNKHISSTTDSKLQWGPVGPLVPGSAEDDESIERWGFEVTLVERQLFARDAFGRVRQVVYTTTANVD